MGWQVQRVAHLVGEWYLLLRSQIMHVFAETGFAAPVTMRAPPYIDALCLFELAMSALRTELHFSIPQSRSTKKQCYSSCL